MLCAAARHWTQIRVQSGGDVRGVDPTSKVLKVPYLGMTGDILFSYLLEMADDEKIKNQEDAKLGAAIASVGEGRPILAMTPRG